MAIEGVSGARMGRLPSTTAVMGGPMTQRFNAQPAGTGEQTRPLLTYNQQQQWPNQGSAGDSTGDDDQEPDDEGDVDSSADDADDQYEEDAAAAETVPDSIKALKAERQRSNRLEQDIRQLKCQLSQFSKINPEEYERLQQAEADRLEFERQLASREKQLERTAARKVQQIAKERDEAREEVLRLRKDRLLERLFIDADGRPGGDNRGSFFEIFRNQVGSEFRLASDQHGRDYLEPIDSTGAKLLGNDGEITANEHVENLRTHPVLSFLFNQRGAIGPSTVIAEFDGNGQPVNLANMSTSELYLASYARKKAGARA